MKVLTLFLFAILLASGKCHFIDTSMFDAEDMSVFERVFQNGFDFKFKVTYPGTKWCGTGNTAKNEEDLGKFKDSDKCCKEHEQCPETVPAGTSKFGLVNTADYSRKSCECDEAFRKCLKAIGGTASGIIGKGYFNLLKTKCFRMEHRIIGCDRFEGIIKKTCVVYRLDKTTEKVLQWVDVPEY